MVQKRKVQSRSAGGKKGDNRKKKCKDSVVLEKEKKRFAERVGWGRGGGGGGPSFFACSMEKGKRKTSGFPIDVREKGEGKGGK